MVASFPGSAYSTNAQDTGNDGPDNDELAQASDYNKHDEEIQALTNAGRDSYIRAFHNDTGGVLTKGTLIRIAGRDAATGLPTVLKVSHLISGSGLATFAEYIVVEDTNDAANGNLARRHVITGLNTSGQSPGNLVYLGVSSGTFQFTPIQPANEDSKDRNIRQFVGRVLRVDVSVGSIEFNILEEDLLQTARIEGWSNAAPSVAAGVTITLTAQIVDKYGVNIDGKIQVNLSLSDGSEFDDSSNGTVTITTNVGNTIIGRMTSKADLILLTSTSGLIDIDFDSGSAEVVFARLIGPDGMVKTSKLTWT